MEGSLDGVVPLVFCVPDVKPKPACVIVFCMGRRPRVPVDIKVRQAEGLVFDRMRRIRDEQERLSAELVEVVAHGRALGLTWQDFGEAFGITRQAARQRWGRREDAQARAVAEATARTRVEDEATAEVRRRQDAYEVDDDGELVEVVEVADEDWGSMAVAMAQEAMEGQG